jgi:hypothetical protein
VSGNVSADRRRVKKFAFLRQMRYLSPPYGTSRPASA